MSMYCLKVVCLLLLVNCVLLYRADKFSDPVSHFSYVSNIIFSPNAQATVDGIANNLFECAGSCYNKSDCNAFMITNKECLQVNFTYEELKIRNGLDERENEGIYFSNFRSKFRLLMNAYPILMEESYDNLISVSAEICARKCYAFIPGCKSFTYVRAKKECIFLKSEYPVETGLIQFNGVDLYELLRDDNPLDYFFMTLREATIKAPYESNNVSLNVCADRCLRGSDWSAFQYDSRRKICSLYSILPKGIQLSDNSQQGIFFFEKKDSNTYYFSGTNGDINVVQRSMIGQRIKSVDSSDCAESCLKSTDVCRAFMWYLADSTCQMIRNSAFVPETPQYNATEYLYSMIPFSECPHVTSPKVIYDMTGEIASPGWPWPFYTNNVSCLWRMASLSGRSYFIKINQLDLIQPDATTCKEASLVINNKAYCKRDEIGEFKNFLEIPESTFDIRFNPGFVASFRQGFTLNYQLDWSCGTKDKNILLDKEGTIASPGYPHVNGYKSCYWRIKSPSGKNISLVLKEFLVDDGGGNDPIKESCYISNSLEVGKKKYCGKAPPDYVIDTGSSETLIKFDLSYKEFNGKFKIEFYFGSIPDTNKKCNQVLTVDDDALIVNFSGNALPKIHEFTCDFFVNSTENGYGLQIQFMKLGVGALETFLTCPSGWVKIFDGIDRGASPILAELCGTQTPSEIYRTSQSSILISMHLLANLIQIPQEKFGFIVNITRFERGGNEDNSTNDKECPIIEDGVVTSPGYPLEDYPYNSYCQWKLSKDNCQKLNLVNENVPLNNKLLRLSFQEFNLATIKPPLPFLGRNFCDMDFLQVKSRDSNKEIFLHCGVIPRVLLKDYLFKFDDTITAVFSSDDRWNSKGFQLTMEEVVFFDTQNGDNNNIIYDNSLLLSPSWPDSYNLNAEMSWPMILPSTEQKAVHLVFTHVDLGPNSCDYVQLEVIEHSKDNKVTKFCKRSDLTSDNQNLFEVPVSVKLKPLMMPINRPVTIRILVEFRDLPTTQQPIPTTTTYRATHPITTGENLVKPTEPSTSIFPIIGGVAAVVIILIIATISGLMYWRRRKISEDKDNLLEMEPEWEENKIYRSVDDVIREKRVARSVYPSVMYNPNNDEVNFQDHENTSD